MIDLNLPNVAEFCIAAGFITLGMVLAALSYFWHKRDKTSVGPAFLALAALVAIALSFVFE